MPRAAALLLLRRRRCSSAPEPPVVDVSEIYSTRERVSHSGRCLDGVWVWQSTSCWSVGRPENLARRRQTARGEHNLAAPSDFALAPFSSVARPYNKGHEHGFLSTHGMGLCCVVFVQCNAAHGSSAAATAPALARAGGALAQEAGQRSMFLHKGNPLRLAVLTSRAWRRDRCPGNKLQLSKEPKRSRRSQKRSSKASRRNKLTYSYAYI